jgi:hypothetical protein
MQSGRWPGVLAIAVALATLPLATAAEVRTNGAAEPAAAPSGIVRVTAGEHGDFSRVVFALGGGLSYRAEPERAGFRIVFPDALVGFEYGDVYPERRAHRVVMAEPALGAEGASLRLRFGCDCGVRTFTLGEKLVVDIFDAASTAPAPARAGRAPGGDATPAAPDRRPQGAGERAGERAGEGTGGVAPQPAARNALADAGDQGQPRPEFLRRVEGLSPEPYGAPAPDGGAFDPEHLQRMLAWAIDHGHLTGASQGDDRALPSRPEDADPPVAGPPVPAASAATSAPGGAVGGPGAAGAAPDGEAAAADPASSCPGALALDMAILGGAGTFAIELARRQDALSRALAADLGIAEAQQALAGFYLARLMPQEALGVLDMVDREGGGDPTPTWLEAAALVLADRASELPADALRSSSCESADALLWRAVVVAARGPVPKGLLNSDVIPLRLATYPPALRVELGLRLADAGIDALAPEAMAQLLDLVEAAAPAAEARARLLFLRGRLAAARGDFAGARTSWQGASNLPGEGGLRATLALLEGDLEHDRLDEAEALTALERLTYDWRGHPAQLDIARLTAAIYERRGRLADALGALEEVALGAAGRHNGRAAARLATDLMRRTYAADAAAAPPADQLTAFWRYEGFVPPGPEGADVQLAFARTLIAQGLPGPAIRLLEPVASDAYGPLAGQAIDLLAEGYLAINQPSKTLDLLRTAAKGASEPNPGRNRLAARALAALGRFAEAAGLLHGGAGDDTAELQADYLWKAGLWKDAAVAYRELLDDDQGAGQADTGQSAAIRLAAAAYMARQPEIIARSARLVEAAGADHAGSAFTPLPAPGSAAARTTATRLLEQARGLGVLAEQYGLVGPQTP